MAKLGRPKKDTKPMNLRMETEFFDRIDNLRRQEPDLPIPPEMVRRILAREFERQDLDRAH